MRSPERFGLAMAFAILCNSSCSSKKDDESKALGVADRRDETYCYRQIPKSPTYISKQISFVRSGNCKDYDGGYVAYLSEDKIAEKFVGWWSLDGKKKISEFAKKRGRVELFGAINDGLKPFLIAFDQRSANESIEVSFSSSVFNYIVLLRPSDFEPVDVKVWQEE